MSTLVFFHAHPDDECISTGGTMARAQAEGHRVILVIATDGAYGEKPEDLGAGETLVDRRGEELVRSAAALGVDGVYWLGFVDSGMTGWEQNNAPGSFWSANVESAGARLAHILKAEQADVLVAYDWHGNYGHPDHVQVHRVGHAAARQAGTAALFEATVNRDEIREFMKLAAEMGGDVPFDPDAPADDGNPFGEPAAVLTHRVDVAAFIDQKRASMACHASQISDSSFFLTMPEEQFRAAFGTEWYIKVGAPAGGSYATWLLD
jgi:LmbE family N-acetylglucosaminyl deacetylase